METINQAWDLDAIFEGGSDSAALKTFIEHLTKDIETFNQDLHISQAPKTTHDAQLWKVHITNSQNITKKIIEASAFIGCLSAQNVKDQKAKQLDDKIKSLYAHFSSALTQLDEQMTQIPEDVWDNLLKDEELQKISFPLNESRTKALDKLSANMEALINTLGVDGFHAWDELYNTIVGNIVIDYDGEELSVGQAANKMTSGNRDVRRDVFNSWESAWQNNADLCASAINHIAGFRLNVYEQRGWDDFLKEPLEYNRMSEKTLNAMWDAITRKKQPFVDFLKRKAKLLNIDKLSWFDVEAPLTNSVNKVSYEEGAEFIVKHFGTFNPKMASFAKHAIENRWVESEDRPGKRPGGFCTSFPLQEESRIFMTYSGTPSNISTLAHELGHAYHSNVMNDLPQMAQNYAMNVAETASTFAEMIVVDASIKEATTDEERINLLEDKIQRSIAFFMNIHARYLFETRFYAERKNGLVSTDRLNELMLEAQKEAFCDVLDEYHPSFWESKLHFYITGVSFYNFPYTFGYLFSTGIYARALEEGATFADKYDAILRDTASMTVESLAQKHLNVDLTKPDFWESAIDLAISDVEEFLRLTEKR